MMKVQWGLALQREKKGEFELKPHNIPWFFANQGEMTQQCADDVAHKGNQQEEKSMGRPKPPP